MTLLQQAPQKNFLSLKRKILKVAVVTSYDLWEMKD